MDCVVVILFCLCESRYCYLTNAVDLATGVTMVLRAGLYTSAMFFACVRKLMFVLLVCAPVVKLQTTFKTGRYE